MAKKESFLSKLRGESSHLNEEQELRKELLNLKISLSSGQLKETHKIKEIKKSIAQLKTIQKETLKEQNKDG
ncbi:MAG: 50S ribosomal protein L29 [SAR86 cluster bacterium]|nr:50S ribosomal protein L29 [SAR86 cluster bacterium]